MRRESHRRRGLSRASSGGWGHRAVYVGAVIAAAALVAGFGVAVLVYGPIGTPFHQLSGSTLGSPPRGVEFGSASEVLATDLNLSNLTGFPTWNWTNATGNFTGPCNESGIFNGTTFVGASNNSTPVNISVGGNTTTLVCLNSVNNGVVNANVVLQRHGGPNDLQQLQCDQRHA